MYGGFALLSMTMDKPKILAGPLFYGRKVLWMGCAFIMTVVCASTADVIYSLRKTAAKSDREVAAFRERSHLLDTLRGAMLRSVLLPESDTGRAISKQDLPAAHSRVNQLLEEFRTSLEGGSDQATQQRLKDLRASIDIFWDQLPDFREVNHLHPHESSPLDQTPDRIQIRHIARQIMELNTQQQDSAEAQIHREQQSFQRELVSSVMLTLLVLFGFVLGISHRIRKTEYLAERLYLEVVRHAPNCRIRGPSRAGAGR